MSKIAIALWGMCAIVVLPSTAFSATDTQCAYNNTVYSLGSIICVGKTRGLRCAMGPKPSVSAATAQISTTLKPVGTPPASSDVAQWYMITEPNDPLNDGCVTSSISK
jgi:hypothetical protein